MNQIGTVTGTLDTIDRATKASSTGVVSHRSGGRKNTTRADVVVACTAGQIKRGSLSHTDRIAQYNQFLRSEETLGDAGRHSGKKFFHCAVTSSVPSLICSPGEKEE